jgi:hypothetical protein
MKVRDEQVYHRHIVQHDPLMGPSLGVADAYQRKREVRLSGRRVTWEHQIHRSKLADITHPKEAHKGEVGSDGRLEGLKGLEVSMPREK